MQFGFSLALPHIWTQASKLLLAEDFKSGMNPMTSSVVLSVTAVGSVTACTFSVRSLCYCLYIIGKISVLLPVHFRYALCVTACIFSVRSLCYFRYIFGTISVLLPVHFRHDLCVTACIFSVRSLCYCLYIFGTLCVTSCTFSFHVCHTAMM